MYSPKGNSYPEEQKAIASLLEKWDTAIEKTEAKRLIEAKGEGLIRRFKWLLKTLISDQQDNPEWQRFALCFDFCEFITRKAPLVYIWVGYGFKPLKRTTMESVAGKQVLHLLIKINSAIPP